MRRADRLFQIVQHLRARRLTTAAQLAKLLEVSERTIYRDVRGLLLTGIPIEGEAGVGYRIHPSFELTPLMFTTQEIEAVVAGLRMVEVFTSPELHKAAQSALSKITLAIPEERRKDLERPRLFTSNVIRDEKQGRHFDQIRYAIDEHRKMQIVYQDGEAKASERIIWPLGLHFWGRCWTLASWCELRVDFRSFRLDRIQSIAVLELLFRDEPGRTLADFLKHVGAVR
jgi:predicted DNA-binding transcriptional regulator YafY